MNCPVCGKGKYQLLDGIDGPIENPTQPVSHLACVEHIAEDFDKLQREKKHAEAELAALKGRRCETCSAISNCYVFDRAVNHTEPYFGTFACNRWAARAEEGGE